MISSVSSASAMRSAWVSEGVDFFLAGFGAGCREGEGENTREVNQYRRTGRTQPGKRRKTHLLRPRRLDRLDPLPTLHGRSPTALPLRYQKLRINLRLFPPLRRPRLASFLIVQRRSRRRRNGAALRALVLLRFQALAFRLTGEGVDWGLEAFLLAFGRLCRERVSAS